MCHPSLRQVLTICYALVLSGRKSGFRAGFRPYSRRESLTIGFPAGFRPAEGPIAKLSRLESDRILPGSSISGPEALITSSRSFPHLWPRRVGKGAWVHCRERIFINQPMNDGEIFWPMVGTAWCIHFASAGEAEFIHQAVPTIGRTISPT
jgi:hypothetical protein